MSDVFQGPGWWMASDGKWYAPDRHPDEKYRKQFMTPPEVPSSAFPSVGLDTTEPAADDAPNSPFSEMVRSVNDDERAEEGQREQVRDAVVRDESASLPTTPQLQETIEISGEELRAEMTEVEAQRREISNAAARAAESPTPDEAPIAEPPATAAPPLTSQRWVQASDPSAAQAQPQTSESAAAPSAEAETPQEVTSTEEKRPRFSVASPQMTPPLERPVFERSAPASVVEAPATPRVEGRTELELGRARRATGLTVGRVAPASPGLGAAPPVSTSTALVHVPGPAPLATFDHATSFDRVVASVMFSAGVAMIVGSFLNWTAGTLEQTGWDRGDGIVAVVAGVVGASASGPIFVGFRHIVPKFVAIIAGLVGIAAVGLVAIDVLLDEQDTGTTLGLGFVVVLVGAIAMIGAGLADRGEVLH